MPMLYGSIDGVNGKDPDLSKNAAIYPDQSSGVSKETGDDHMVCTCATSTMRIRTDSLLLNPTLCSHKKMTDENETTSQVLFHGSSAHTVEESKQPAVISTISGEESRIFSTFVSLSINRADLNGSIMPLQSPLRKIKTEDDRRGVTPISKGIETLPHFFDCLPDSSFYPFFAESVDEHRYFPSPQSKDEEASMFNKTPSKSQASSKDCDMISTMLSPLPYLVPKVPTPSLLKGKFDNDVGISTAKRQGKSLERLLEYKNKKMKSSKGTKKTLPIKKSMSHPRRASNSDDDEDYDESDKENQCVQTKPLHAKATRCVPVMNETSINVTNSIRNIEHYHPSDDVVALLAPAKATDVTFPVIDRCKCTKSRCLKLYCDCFQAGQICTSSCDCISCENTKNHSKPGGLRFLAIESLLLRRPDAFEHRPKKAGEGCKCKKNRCLKKYCDCFNSGISCSSRCMCEDCKNLPDDDVSLVNQKMNKKSRRVTRHTEKAQDEKEAFLVTNHRRKLKTVGRENMMDNDASVSPTQTVLAESDENSTSEDHTLFSKHDFLSALPSEDLMQMMHYGYASTGTPTNMEAI